MTQNVENISERVDTSSRSAQQASDYFTVQDNFQYPTTPTPVGDQDTSDEDGPARRYPLRDRRPPERLMFVI